jgi:hypothetical protein
VRITSSSGKAAASKLHLGAPRKSLYHEALIAHVFLGPRISEHDREKIRAAARNHDSTISAKNNVNIIAARNSSQTTLNSNFGTGGIT